MSAAVMPDDDQLTLALTLVPSDILDELRDYADYASLCETNSKADWSAAAGFFAAFCLARGDIDPAVHIIMNPMGCGAAVDSHSWAKRAVLNAATRVIRKLLVATHVFRPGCWDSAIVKQHAEAMQHVSIRHRARATELVRETCAAIGEDHAALLKGISRRLHDVTSPGG
jgi:hypothetical protein